MTDNRWAWAEVDLGAIARNVRTLKGLTTPGTRFMAVVKSDGYGHGAVQVARAAKAAGADWLGVATVAEGVELREAGIEGRILVLSEPPETSIPVLVDNELTPTAYTRDFALALAREGVAIGRDLAFHLKVDTGMHRIGVRAEEAPEFAAGLKGVPGLRHEGTFTHFATADVPGDWDFERQLERFNDAIAAMRTEGVDPGIVHAANSPATILHPEAHFDMVRCGIALYGLHPDKSTYDVVELAPAMAVKARASLVKRIGMGDGVSYGLTWVAAAPTMIATLPLGYADGVHRVLSNTMKVLVGGERASQVGRVCMDQLMVEVPRGAEVRRGDEFVLVGTQGNDRISMDEMAELAGTINYEVACAFGMRLPRVYR